MINRELIDVFSEIAREKNVDRSELGSIIEQLFCIWSNGIEETLRTAV